ncbi:MAG: hypothetical protein JWO09_868 [Bacteroidetes bacterium]|nr:hypothetical protein [Bacteroidota bacterium]
MTIFPAPPNDNDKYIQKLLEDIDLNNSETYSFGITNASKEVLDWKFNFSVNLVRSLLELPNRPTALAISQKILAIHPFQSLGDDPLPGATKNDCINIFILAPRV